MDKRKIELNPKKKNNLLMITKYCVRKQIDLCLLDRPETDDQTKDLFIEDNSGKYGLFFECRGCKMQVFSF
jgi:hypothetical protein